MMRNDTTDSKKFKSLNKDPAQEIKLRVKELSRGTLDCKNNAETNKQSILLKDELLLRLSSINKNLVKNVEARLRVKSENDDICNRKDVKDSIQKAKSQFINNECPQLKKNHISELNKKLAEKNSNNSNSCENNKNKQQISCETSNDKTNPNCDSKDILKRIVKDHNPVHKVSFKTKNFSKKPIYNSKISTKFHSSTVASLTQKFNEIIKENDLITKNSKTSLILECKNKSECINVKLGKKNTFIIQKSSSNKRSNSINSFDKINVINSPLLKKKVFRVKSDSAEKKRSIQRRKSPEYFLTPLNGSSKGVERSSHVSDSKIHVKRPTYKTFSNRHSSNVRATIQKFESAKPQIVPNEDENSIKNTVIKLNIISDKPKIPEKKVNLLKTKNLVIRDGKPKIKFVKTNISENKLTNNTVSNDESFLKYAEIQHNSDVLKTENDFPLNCIADHISIDENLKTIASEDVHTPQNNCVENTCDKIKEINVSEKEYAKIDNSHKEDFHEDVTARIQPNQSFLWRNTSKELTANKKNSLNLEYNNMTFSVEPEKKVDSSLIYEPTVDEFFHKFDKLIESKKKEIADEVKKEKNNTSHDTIVEAINQNVNLFEEEPLEALNEVAITDIGNNRHQAFKNIDEDYETFDNYGDDIISFNNCFGSDQSLHLKTNCPLPAVPHENIYQCVSDIESYEEGDSISIHSYEYCHNNKTDENPSNNIDNIYEDCKSDLNLTPMIIEIKPDLPERKISDFSKEFYVTKYDNSASFTGYEKISSIYEKQSLLSPHPAHLETVKLDSPETVLNYHSYNSEENIYDTIKHSDSISISNCYESIPESPHSIIKMHQKRNLKNLMLTSNTKSVPFDSISNFSQSCSGSMISSDQKTNSIYDQRSIVSLDTSTIVSYGKAPSEISSSDRSDDWEDLPEPELTSGNSTTSLLIVCEFRRENQSPRSWSTNVRHHWNKSSKEENVFVSSPSIVYLATSKFAEYYSDNDDIYQASNVYQNTSCVLMVVRKTTVRPKDLKGLAVFKMLLLHDDAFETQELTLLIDMDSGSETEHLYESLSFSASAKNSPKRENFSDDDTDSFDSNSETEQQQTDVDPNSKNSRLPDPPVSNNTYTLTRFANKMKKIKENFTKSTRKKSTSEISKLQSPTIETNQNAIVSDIKSTTQNNPYEFGTKNSDFINNSDTKQPVSAEKTSLNKYKTIFFNSNEGKPSRQNSNDENNDKTTANKTNNENPNNKKTYLSFKSFRRSESSNSQNKSLNSSKRDIPEYKRTTSTFYVDDIFDNNEKSEEKLSKSLNKLNISTDCVKKIENIENNNTNVKANETDGVNTSKKNLPLNVIKSSIPKIPSIRPAAPPPPPPNREDKSVKKERKGINTTSWYSDCDISRSQELKSESNGIHKNRASALSWYAEIGLYQASNVSTSSGTSSNLSGSGTCSTSAFSSPSTPVPPIGMFNQEPLYQFYDAAKLESVYRDINENFGVDSDLYEEIVEDKKPQRPSAMALINPKKSPSRTLWCEVPEVINSAILNSLTEKQRKVQEAKFEIISSEASYLNSLIVLESHFVNHPAFRDEKLISKNDREILFGNLSPVKKCSERLLADLETCWQDNILLHGLSKIIKNHAEKYFSVYVTYCEHQNQLVKTLKKLKTEDTFTEIIYQLQAQPECQSLSLDSFLLLPMQRVTRLPLLVDAVLKNLTETDTEYQQYADTLAILNNVVNQCNEAARNFERKEEMTLIASQLEFPQHIQEIQLMMFEKNKQNSKLQRWLVRSGDLTHFTWRVDDQSKLTFGKKIQKTAVYLFLFTDLLIITKKKSNEDKYTVIDYCKRSLVEIASSETMSQSPKKESMGKYSILLTMLENFENKTIEMLLSCKSESDRQRWLEACSLPSSEDPNERIYEVWDQPQVAAMYPYQSTQPDELSLQRGDIVYVNKKIVDGWFHGERMRDGESGWFPGNYTVEIASAHARARNIKQRYRLLNLFGSYLNQQKKKAS